MVNSLLTIHQLLSGFSEARLAGKDKVSRVKLFARDFDLNICSLKDFRAMKERKFFKM